jgi:hypothetical protein
MHPAMGAFLLFVLIPAVCGACDDEDDDDSGNGCSIQSSDDSDPAPSPVPTVSPPVPDAGSIVGVPSVVPDGGYCFDVPGTIECWVPECNGGFVGCLASDLCESLSRCPVAIHGDNGPLDAGVDGNTVAGDGSAGDAEATEAGVTGGDAADAEPGDSAAAEEP